MRKRLLSRRADQCVVIRSRLSIPSAAGSGGSFTANALPGQVETIDVMDAQGPVVSAGGEDRTVVRKRQAAEITGLVRVERPSPLGPGSRVPEADTDAAAGHQKASVGRERGAGEGAVVSGKRHALRAGERVPEAHSRRLAVEGGRQRFTVGGKREGAHRVRRGRPGLAKAAG